MVKYDSDKAKQEAFMALYTPIHSRFMRFCSARAYQSSDAKDLAGETLLVAYEKLDKLKEEKAFLYFLFGIAQNLLHRKYRRQKKIAEYDEQAAIQRSDTRPTPDQQTDLSLLYEAINELPDIYRDAVILADVAGFSMQEAADIQNVGLSAIKVRVKRGREKLRGLVSDKEMMRVPAES